MFLQKQLAANEGENEENTDDKYTSSTSSSSLTSTSSTSSSSVAKMCDEQVENLLKNFDESLRLDEFTIDNDASTDYYEDESK